jgi:hypothetical protein
VLGVLLGELGFYNIVFILLGFGAILLMLLIQYLGALLGI